MKGLVLTYLLTYGGAVISLFRPFDGFLIYVAFALLRPEALWGWAMGTDNGNFSRIVAIALLVGWTLRGFGNWKLGRAWGVTWLLLGFWGWLLVAGFQVIGEPLVRNYLEAMSKTFLPCVVAISLITSVAQLRQLAWVIVVAQGYLAFEFNLQYRAGQIIESEWTFASLDNNGIAITMVTSLGLAFFLGLHASRWWQKLFAFGAAGLMMHVVLFSLSRGGMLALGVAGLTIFLLMPKSPKHYLAFGLGALLVIRLAGPEVVQEFQSIFAEKHQRDASAESRLALTKACFQAMTEHPIFGLGPSRWAAHAHEYGFTRGKAGHTTWFQVGAENGVVGFVLLPAFYLLCLRRLWPISRGGPDVIDPWLSYLAKAVIAALAGFIVSAQFVSIEGAELPYFLATIGAGILKLQSTGLGRATAPRWGDASVQGVGLGTPFVSFRY